MPLLLLEALAYSAIVDDFLICFDHFLTHTRLLQRVQLPVPLVFELSMNFIDESFKLALRDFDAVAIAHNLQLV